MNRESLHGDDGGLPREDLSNLRDSGLQVTDHTKSGKRRA